MANRFTNRFNDSIFNRQSLLNKQRIKVQSSDAVLKLLKKKAKGLKKTKKLRGELAQNVRLQKKFEKGERRDKPQDNVRIVGEPIYKDEQTKFLKRFLELEEVKIQDKRLVTVEDTRNKERDRRELQRQFDLTTQSTEEREQRLLQRGLGEVEKIINRRVQEAEDRFTESKPIKITEFKQRGNRGAETEDRTSRPKVTVEGLVDGAPFIVERPPPQPEPEPEEGGEEEEVEVFRGGRGEIGESQQPVIRSKKRGLKGLSSKKAEPLLREAKGEKKKKKKAVKKEPEEGRIVDVDSDSEDDARAQALFALEVDDDTVGVDSTPKKKGDIVSITR